MHSEVVNELVADHNIIDSMLSSSGDVDFNLVIPMPEVLRRNPSESVKNWALIATGAADLSHLSDPPRSDREVKVIDRIRQINTVRLLMNGPFPKDFSDSDFDDFLACVNAIRDLGGLPSWSEWCSATWGTRENAYDTFRVNPNRVRFNTSMSMPSGILHEVSNMLGDGEHLRMRWASASSNGSVGDVMIDCVDGKLEATVVDVGDGDELRRDLLKSLGGNK